MEKDYATTGEPQVLDQRALAQAMLDWSDLMHQAKAIEEKIEATVIRLEKTQVVGDVRATYYSGRRKYEYEDAWVDAYEKGLVEERHPLDFSKVTYDYRQACAAHEIDADGFARQVSGPSVKVKLEA